jgi:hypothetical protein
VRFSFTAALLLYIASAGGAAAQEEWTASPVDATSLPSEIASETQRKALDGLPDGLVATHAGKGDIVSAWYGAPTTRYGHGILGDAIEAGELIVKSAKGRTFSLVLPPSEVFEDRYPRLADLDGDGTVEVVAIRSSLTFGASVAGYGLRKGTVMELASTPFIGRANRWLNIADIARFRGRRGREIAYVQTPHIGGTLFLYAFEQGRLTKIGSLGGFSNHFIGSRDMRLSAVADIDGDGRMELALPSANRYRLRIIGFGKSGPAYRAGVDLSAAIDKAIAVRGAGLMTRFIVGLENGQIFEIRR